MSYSEPLLAILEGKWFPRGHVSLPQFFHTLFSLNTGFSDDAYHYEMFTTRDALANAMRRAFQKGSANTIYVAAHATAKCIDGFGGYKIRRIVFRNVRPLAEGPSARAKRHAWHSTAFFSGPADSEQRAAPNS